MRTGVGTVMRVTILAAVALAAVAAGAAPASDGVPLRPCGSRGDPSDGKPVRFVRPHDLVIGPLSFTGLGNGVRAGGRDAEGRFFTKSGAKVLWGAGDVTVTSPTDGILVYARPNARTAMVKFQPCPPGTITYAGTKLRRVTGFPGGFSFAKRGCYPLTVQVASGRTYRGTVKLGVARCA
jgi:hypothetical protein